jgi:hypothetical protein
VPQHPSSARPSSVPPEAAPFAEHDRFAALLSDERPDASESPQEAVRVIPLGSGESWTLKVGPPSAAKAAESRFARRELSGVMVSPAGREALFLGALDPGGVADEKIKRQRVSNGWLLRIDDVRLFTPLVNLSPANDRLLADTIYAADPTLSASGGVLSAVPMPTSHPDHSSLVYACDRTLLRDASDVNMERVLKDNPVDVGTRIIEQPITLVVAAYAPGVDSEGYPALGPDSAAPEELVTVDGNSRTAAAFRNVSFEVHLLPQRLHALYAAEPLVTLRPSLLNQMTYVERRDLTRKLLKFYSDHFTALRQREARGPLGERDRRSKDAAARALNSLTVPATVIVGYIDDDSMFHGNARFATAVREVLQGMNVAPKPFDEGARIGVSAEQAVAALHDARLLGPQGCTTAVSGATLDTLIGRTPVADAMAPLDLTALADLRAAVVVREFTRSGPQVSRVLQGPLNTTQVHLKHRSAPVVELALRGYTARNDAKQIDSMRKVLFSGSGGCLWRGLLSTPLEVLDIATDNDVDGLAELALQQLKAAPALPQGALCLLGVLGMTALVTGGYLLAAGGSGEHVAAGLENVTGRVSIQRGSVGSVVEALLGREWGVRLLADAVKRSRSGLRPRLIDASTGEFAELPPEHGVAHVNAALRRMLKKADEPDVEELTHADKQRRAFTAFAQSLASSKESLAELLALHSDRRELIPFAQAEASLLNLDAIAGNFRSIVEPRPLDLS